MTEKIRLVRDYIFENFLFGADDSSLDNNDSFLDKGVIDSTGILEVVNWIEETFAISVDDHELVPDNFDSINKLAAFLERKTT